jgi:uncharacterized protein
MPSPAGQFIWYDLITTDLDAAIDFYKEVTGWGTQASKGPQAYTMWENEGIPLGGLVPAGGEMGSTPAWLPYVAVSDVDKTAAKASELGGKISVAPKDIPGSGRYAIVTDPQGASIAIFQSGTPATGTEVTPGRGQFSWHDLSTTDHEKAFDFYSALFGWESRMRFDMGPMGIYHIFGSGDRDYGGMSNFAPESTGSPNWLCYVLIDDVHKTAERVKELGGEVLMGPHEVPGGSWIVHCRDPQGASFALHMLKPQ